MKKDTLEIWEMLSLMARVIPSSFTKMPLSNCLANTASSEDLASSMLMKMILVEVVMMTPRPLDMLVLVLLAVSLDGLLLLNTLSLTKMFGVKWEKERKLFLEDCT